MKPELYATGEIVGRYRVLDPTGHCGLPVAVIIDGPNTGIRVYLTTPYRNGATIAEVRAT